MSEATKTKTAKPEADKPDAIDIKSMNIFQRMAAITDELGAVEE